MAFIIRSWTGFDSVDDALAEVKQALIDAGWTDMSYGTPTVHMLATAVVATKADGTQCGVYMELRKETVSGVDVLNAYFWQYPNKTGSSHGFGLPIMANTISGTFNLYANEFWFAIYNASNEPQYPTVAGAYHPLSNDLSIFPINPWFRLSFRDTTSNTRNRDGSFTANLYGFCLNYLATNFATDSIRGFYLVRDYTQIANSVYTDPATPALVYLYPPIGDYYIQNTSLNYRAFGFVQYAGISFAQPAAVLGDTVQIGSFIFQTIAIDKYNCGLWGRVQ